MNRATALPLTSLTTTHHRLIVNPVYLTLALPAQIAANVRVASEM
jgi:hypothetical protein